MKRNEYIKKSARTVEKKVEKKGTEEGGGGD